MQNHVVTHQKAVNLGILKAPKYHGSVHLLHRNKTTLPAITVEACRIVFPSVHNKVTYREPVCCQRSGTIPRVVRQKNMVMSPIGPGTKNDCAGDGQQQFTRSDQTEELCLNKIRRLLSKHDIKTIHIPVKKNIHMVRPTNVKVGLSHWDIHVLYLT
jgi:hypothetical protein